MPDFLLPNPEGGGMRASGDVATRLLANNMDVSALRTNDTLMKDEWELLDTTVVTVARERLTGVADLMARGLTFNVPNGLGTLIVQHQTATEMTAASVTMDAVTRDQRDRILFELVNTPLPVTHKDFYINIRTLAASRKEGQPLDTTMAAEASRQVSETLEDTLFNGLSSGDTLGFGASSGQLFGYTNRTNRNTVTLAENWDASSATGEDIVDDVISMVNAAHADRHFGPFVLYVPSNYWVTLQNDFKANSDKTILQRIREIDGIMDVKPADKLTDDNVVLVEMTTTNVDEVIGMEPTTIFWETQGGMTLNFKVMAIMIPRIKLDPDNRSGVVHLS